MVHTRGVRLKLSGATEAASRSRLAARVVCLLLYLVSCRLPAASHVTEGVPVTSIAEARQGRIPFSVPVRLRGVITAFSGWKNSFFLQDGTGGISIDRQEDERVQPGDIVEVSGLLHPGLFAPVMLSDRVQWIAHGQLPQPYVASYTDLARGQFDSRLIEVTGVVHEVRIGQIWGRQILLIDLHTPEGTVTVHVLRYPKRDFGYLVDSTIRVKGVCGTIFNDRQQILGLRLFAPDVAAVAVVSKSIDPSRLAVLPINSLMRFNGPSLEHRLKVTGTVTDQLRENEFYLQQGGAAIRVQSSRSGRWLPGVQLNAWGFVSDSGSILTLRNAGTEELGRRVPIKPIRISAADAIKNEDGFSQAPYDGLLVELKGQVLELLPNTQTQLWELRAGHVQFQAQLALSRSAGSIAPEPGTQVTLTGVLVAEADENHNLKSFRILLRSPNDMRVANEPYWTSSFLLLSAIVCLVVLGSLGLWLFHRREREAAQEEIFDAASLALMLRFRRASWVFAGLAVFLGSLVVLGWTLNIPVLQIHWSYVAPMPNAALAILAAGMSVCMINSKGGRKAFWIATACTSLATGIAALTLFEYITSWDLHIDQLLFRDLSSIPAGLDAGRMAIPTAFCIVLTGCAISLIPYRRWTGFGHVLAISSGMVGLLNWIDGIYGTETKYGLGAHAIMAPATAIGLVLLSLAVLASRPDCGVMKTVCVSGIGGLMARRLLPVALVAPVCLGWIRLQGQVAGFYGTRFGLALFALLNIICFAFMIWSSAVIHNDLDRSRSRAQEALRDRDRKLEMVFETASMGDWTWDVRKDELTAQRVVWDLYGEPDGLSSAPAEWFTRRQHPDDAAMIASELAMAITQRRPFDMEFRVVQADGNERWVFCRGTGIYDNAGELSHVNGINIDITDRKLAQLQVKESELRFSQLADAMPQIVWTARADGQIDYYNRRWYEYTGAVLETPWQEIVHPDDLDVCSRSWMKSVADGSDLQLETRFRGADGSYRWQLSRAVPVRNVHGKIERWFGTSTDIDDFKQASAELRTFNDSLEARVEERSGELAESERRHRLLVEGVQDYAIYMLDAEGGIATWNVGAERITGYTSSEALAKHFSLFYTPEAIAALHPENELLCALSEGQYREEEWRVRKDESLFWASVLITPIRDAEGKVTGFSNIIRDLTLQKTAEQLLIAETRRAEEANRAKSSFLAAMSHEIRTPMNAILGMADLLWETDLSKLQREYVNRFRRAGTNLLTLINDILDLSKIESGQFELETVDFSLSDLMERTMELMSPRATIRKIELASRIVPGTSMQLVGDPGRLQQILNNLVGNALKFTEGGKVLMTVENHHDNVPGRLQFTVADTGIGIPADKLTSIFDDFTQAESSTTRRFGGTGLGLGICQRLVHRMGGELTAQSVFGEGSTFIFDVILKENAHPIVLESGTGIDLSGRSVLVVDDDSTNRLILCEMAIRWGMIPVEAGTAWEASNLVRRAVESEDLFSLVLLDRIMPDVDGLVTLASLLSLDPGLPIIVTSSDYAPRDLTKAKAIGAVGYLTKPIRSTELLTFIAENVHQRQPNSHMALVTDPSVPSTNNRESEHAMTILVADDSEDNRFLVEAYLANQPYELTFVENGLLAVEAFSDRGFDLVLMDVNMPVMDGLSAAAAIRVLDSERSSKPIPIVALTADAMADDVARSRAAGCNAHLSKPISKEKLISVIEGFRVVTKN